MARKEISTPLDLENMENHNYMNKELYSLIDETDRRISENMWEEIKDANTMKMLEPVQTAADLPDLASLLPSEEADKSLITVIDEQRVYGFVKGEWQPFIQIDLDMFEPFKEELSEIVAAYESKIQNFTTEVQNTKTSAIDSVESTQSQAESNINQTEQSAVNSINQTQTEAESQISTIRDEMTTQVSDLTALFNDSMDKLTSKQDTALAEVDSTKQAAITAIEEFNDMDTPNWQKFKLTQDDGRAKAVYKVDWADAAQLEALEPGEYYAALSTNLPEGASSQNAFVSVIDGASGGVRRIEFRPHNSNQLFIKHFYQTWSDWEPADGTKVELFKGSVSGVGSNISLSAPYDTFEYLFVSFDSPAGKQTKIFEAQISNNIIISFNSVYNGGSSAKTHEMALTRTNLTTLSVTNEATYTFYGSDPTDNTVVIERIVGVK